MRLKIDFASGVKYGRSDVKRLVARVAEVGKSGEEFTINDLAIRNSDGERLHNYTAFMSGSTMLSLARSGILEKTRVEKFPVTFEEENYRYREEKVFIDIETNSEVEYYQMKEGRNYKVVIKPAGRSKRMVTVEGRRNVYKMNLESMEQYDTLLSQFIDNKYNVEKQKAFN